MRILSQEYSQAEGDDRDCAVRALAVAAKLTYEDAHAALFVAGRAYGRATKIVVLERATRTFGAMPISLSAAVPGPRGCEPTLTSFIRTYPRGRYLVCRRGHAFAVVDGQVHDWQASRTGPRSRIQFAWKFDN